MPSFVLARFADGDVVADGWWVPRLGQRVWLTQERDPWQERERLVVSLEPGVGVTVPYTWPRARSPQHAGRLAYRRYRRKAGQRPLEAVDAASS